MNKANWKTTLLGWLGIAGGAIAGLTLILNGHVVEGAGALIGVIHGAGNVLSADATKAPTSTN